MSVSVGIRQARKTKRSRSSLIRKSREQDSLLFLHLLFFESAAAVHRIRLLTAAQSFSSFEFLLEDAFLFQAVIYST